MKPPASIKNSPEDFVVEEIPLYEASGQGDHVFALVRKTGWSTPACIRRIANQLGIDSEDFGHAGMKDRHAVTTQRLSFPWPRDRELPVLEGLAAEGIEVLALERHEHKLRVGHLIGNRFEIVLRDVDLEDRAAIESGLQRVHAEGVPNAFGPQRFGKDGDNPDRTLRWLRGEQRGPKDRRTQSLLLSSVQSMLFDKLLALRVANGTWNTVVLGDLVKTLDRGGMYESEDPEVDAERARAGEVTATGPIFGPRMRSPSGEPGDWERMVLREVVGETDFLGHRKLGAGTRRALRIVPRHFRVEPAWTDATLEPQAHGGEQPPPELASDGRIDIDSRRRRSSLTVRMELPKGAYATTLLGHVFQLRDASFDSRAASNDGV